MQVITSVYLRLTIEYYNYKNCNFSLEAGNNTECTLYNDNCELARVDSITELVRLSQLKGNNIYN